MTQEPQSEQPNQPQSQPWWQTIPGMLTAIAGFLTAITGLLVALNQAGILQPSTQTQNSPSPQASTSPSTAASPEASVTPPSSVSDSIQQPTETQSQDKPHKAKKSK